MRNILQCSSISLQGVLFSGFGFTVSPRGRKISRAFQEGSLPVLRIPRISRRRWIRCPLETHHRESAGILQIPILRRSDGTAEEIARKIGGTHRNGMDQRPTTAFGNFIFSPP